MAFVASIEFHLPTFIAALLILAISYIGIVWLAYLMLPFNSKYQLAEKSKK